jgi:uracil-DNA glycosylase family 4
MVVNNAVKSEKEHLTNKGTRYFLETAKEYDIPASAFYYTGAVKCRHRDKSVSKICLGTCMDFLKREIEVVKPKLIICFATNMLGMFSNERKPTMGKLNGKVIYSKAYDCYVLFSYSPQYAYYSEEKAGPKYKEAMSKLKEIFTCRNKFSHI